VSDDGHGVVKEGNPTPLPPSANESFQKAALLSLVGIAAVAATIAVVGFWLALRQDVMRWGREKRAELYIDLLAEAHAQRQWMIHELTAIEIANATHRDQVVGEWQEHGAFVDVRLPGRERAILEARVMAYATPAVMLRFKALIGTYPVKVEPGTAPAHMVNVGLAFDAVEQQIRDELMKTQQLAWSFLQASRPRRHRRRPPDAKHRRRG
jgi:hypothetical protein